MIFIKFMVVSISIVFLIGLLSSAIWFERPARELREGQCYSIDSNNPMGEITNIFVYEVENETAKYIHREGKGQIYFLQNESYMMEYPIDNCFRFLKKYLIEEK